MIRAWIVSVGLVLTVCLADAQVVKPLDPNKMSEFGQKKFQIKSWTGQEYPTMMLGKQRGYATKPFPVREFSYSSKSFQTKPTDYSSKKVATRSVETKTHSDNSKQFSTKKYETKDVQPTELTHHIADKPTTQWRALTRKEPPKGLPGKHTDIPFSEWKATSETK